MNSNQLTKFETNYINSQLNIINSINNPGQDIINKAEDKYLDGSNMDNFINPLIKTAKKVDSFSALEDEFSKIYSKIDTNDFEEDLLKLRFMSEVTGRLFVQKETKKLKFISVNNYQRLNIRAESPKIDLLECFDRTPESAVDYLKELGIDISWDWKDTIKILKKHNFTIAGVTKADVLQKTKDEILKAVKDGLVFSDWRENLFDTLTKSGFNPVGNLPPSRLELIFRMNTQSALMRGRYLQQTDITKDYPYWEYVSVLDDRTTDGCNDLNGITLLSTESFWNVNYPPRHYNCRATIRTANDSDIKTNGLHLMTDDDSVKWYNPDGTFDYMKLGDIMPADGFDYHPDELWKPDYSKYSLDIRELIDE